MERLLKYVAEQNKFYAPDDSLSKLVNQTLNRAGRELDEEDLFLIQAARGPESYSANHGRGKDV